MMVKNLFEVTKPTVPEVGPRVREFMSRHIEGCCLHVVLADCNWEQHFIDSCVEHARENGHRECLELAETLKRMSSTQRRKLARKWV